MCFTQFLPPRKPQQKFGGLCVVGGAEIRELLNFRGSHVQVRLEMVAVCREEAKLTGFFLPDGEF